MKTNPTRVLLGSLALILLTGSVQAGIIFTATTRSESSRFDIGRIANATVNGWAQGADGKIEYLGSPGDKIAKGTVILTKDGGETAEFYDAVRKICTPWTGNAVVLSAPNNKSIPPKTVEKLEIQKVADQDGPEIAGHATHHFAFRISYSSSLSTSGKTFNSTTELKEDFWVAKDLAEPALQVWLDQVTWPSGDVESDQKIATALSEAEGVPLKRVSSLLIKNEGGRDLQTVITSEVNTLEFTEIPQTTFKEPFRCVNTSPDGP